MYEAQKQNIETIEFLKHIVGIHRDMHHAIVSTASMDDIRKYHGLFVRYNNYMLEIEDEIVRIEEDIRRLSNV